jgi:predicted transcriptional regulator
MAPSKNKNRNAYDIIASILKASRKGAGRTYIMYHANLSFSLLNEYLTRLVQSGLVECQKRDGRVIYSLSKDGTKFLESYHVVQSLYAKKSKRFLQQRKNKEV